VASASDHARTLFSAILPDRRDLLEIVLAQLGPEYFGSYDDGRWHNLFKIFSKYYDIASDVPTKQAISAILAKLPGSDSGKIQLYETTYDSLMEQQSSDSDFRWSLSQIKDIYAQKVVGETLLRGMQVLKQGLETSKGDELRGHEDARELVMAELGVLDQRLTVQEAPDGDIREEEQDFLDEYESRKQSFLAGDFSGIEFGIPQLDKVIGGLQPGELDFVLGYSSSGKSSLCCQLAWNAAIRQQKNVVYVTTETLRTQIRRKLVARHSRLSKFGLDEGINTANMKNGDLSDFMEEKLREVVHDFTNTEDYGKLRIVQASDSMSVTGMKVRLQAIQREFPIDLVVVDALYILASDTKYTQGREQLNEKIEQAMILAKTFNNGNGIPLITPWQASRKAKEDADRDKRYSMSAMAETAYAERYADNVIALLEPPQTQRYTTLSCSVLKHRDGEQSSGFPVDVDYATCYFTDTGRTQQAANNALLGLGLGL
jgi:replicative DNA helicase